MTTKLSRNLADRRSARHQFLHTLRAHRRFASLVNSVRLRLSNALALPFAPQVVFKLCHSAQDRQRQLSRATACVNVLMHALKRNALGRKLV